MTKSKIALIIVGVILLIAIISTSAYLITVRASSKKYNLTKLKADSLPEPVEANEDGFVQLSDLNMHYVRYGEGSQALILIHGNGGSCESLKEAASYLASVYTVYCIDSRCHGKSEDTDVITYDLMAKDVKEFIAAKNLNAPFIMGHSDGGMVALTLASLYPEVPKAVISCGSNSKPETFKFYFTWGVKIKNLFKPDKLNELMLTLPDFNPEFLSRISVPTYIVAGEYDIMPLSDTVYIHNNVKNSEIVILKGENHSSYMSQNGKKAYTLAMSFFPKYE